MIEVVAQPGAAAFLDRAESWLLLDEAQYNLHVSLAYACREDSAVAPEALFATVEQSGAVVGCVIRTPPHKLLVTEMPIEAASEVAHTAAARYGEIPAVLGPETIAVAVADAWTTIRGGSLRRGMHHRIYRLDEVKAVTDVAGSARAATRDDLELLSRWGQGFGRDVGPGFALGAESILRMIDQGQMFIWDDDAPVAMAVARGGTPNGCRVGYVYTPDDRRKRGYASALVAAVSQRMLDSGLTFCILYTDLSNPTSNAIYQR